MEFRNKVVEEIYQRGLAELESYRDYKIPRLGNIRNRVKEPGKGRVVVATNSESGACMEFDSVEEAANHIGAASSTVWYRINKRVTKDGWTFRYSEEG